MVRVTIPHICLDKATYQGVGMQAGLGAKIKSGISGTSI